MAQVEGRASERLVTLDARWFRDEAVDAVRTFVAPFVAVATAMERVSRPREPGGRTPPHGGRDQA